MNVKELDANTAAEILDNMKNPSFSGVEKGSWISGNGKIGGGYKETTMNDTGYFIQVDFSCDDGEEHYIFEPSAKPRNWLECWQETKKEMERLIEGN